MQGALLGGMLASAVGVARAGMEGGEARGRGGWGGGGSGAVLSMCNPSAPAAAGAQNHERPACGSWLPAYAGVLPSSIPRCPRQRISMEVRIAEHLRQHARALRSEEHTSELQSLMRISYAVFCLKKKTNIIYTHINVP